MGKLVFILTFLIATLASAVPKEQDRAILEGNDRNILTNPGFEARKSDWSITGGGTFTLESAAPASGKLTAKWNPSASGEFFRSILIPVPEGLKGRSCSLVFDYKVAGSSGDIKANVDDGTDDLASADLDPSTDYRENPLLAFTCPSSGSIRVELESTVDAAEISVDSMYLGKLKSIQVSQTTLVGSAFYAATTNCNWTRTSTTQGAFTTDADCPALTVELNAGPGVIQAVDADLPQMTVNDLPPGTYVVTVTGQNNNSAGNFSAMSLFDGVTRSGNTGSASSTQPSSTTVIGTFVYSTTGNRTFELHASSLTGTVTLSAHLATQENDVRWTIVKYPTTAAEAITLETVGASWSGFHNQDCVWTIQTGGAFTKVATGDSTCTFTELFNSNFGTVVSEDDGADKIPGIVFTPKVAGNYEICVGVSLEVANGIVNISYRLMDGATVIASAANRVTTGGSITLGHSPNTVCGFASFGVNSKTLSLEFVETGASSASIGSGSVSGQASVWWTIKPISQQFPTPVFTDLTNSLNAKVGSLDTNVFEVSARISNSGTPTLDTQIGSWVGVIDDNGGGDSTINTTVFTQAPHCDCTAFTSGSAVSCLLFTTVSSTEIRVRTVTTSTGSLVDTDFFITCRGK